MSSTAGIDEFLIEIVRASVNGQETTVEDYTPEAAELAPDAKRRYEAVPNAPSPFDRFDLRLDFQNHMISGDLFGPLSAFNSAFVLGGRRNWHRSFFGPFSHVIRTANSTFLCALCETAKVDHASPAPHGFAGIEIRDGEIKDAWYLAREANGARIVCHGDLTATTTETRDYYRHIQLHCLTEDLGAEAKAAAEMVMGTGELSMVAALETLGIKATISKERATRLRDTKAGYSGSCAPKTPSTCADQTIDWSHELHFVDASKDKKNDRLDNLKGLAFGFGAPEDRVYTRHTAIINTKNVLLFPDEEGPKALKAAAQKRAWLVRFTALHELGHLLNMPHAWSRAIGHELLGNSRADAVSWTNYPVYHPFGELSLNDIRTMEEKEKKARRAHFNNQMYEQEQAEMPAGGGFDAAERRFIWHAPLRHIAQGHRSAQTNDLHLEIMTRVADPDSLDPAGIEVAPLAIDAFVIGHPEVSQLPMIPAYLKLFENQDTQGTRTEVPLTAAHLDTGRLQIFLRLLQRLEPRDLLDSLPTRMYTVDMMGGSVPMGTEPERLSHNQIDLPWFEQRRLRKMYKNQIPTRFAMQAVYFDRGEELRSNPVLLNFTTPGNDLRHEFLPRYQRLNKAEMQQDDPDVFRLKPQEAAQMQARFKAFGQEQSSSILSGPPPTSTAMV